MERVLSKVFRSSIASRILPSSGLVFSRSDTTLAQVHPGAQLGTAKSYDDIPRIPSFPLVGIFWAYMPVIGKYKLEELNLSYEKKYREYGKILREDFAKTIRFVYLFDVRDFETYFRQEGRHANRILFETIRAYRNKRPDTFLGGGLTATTGDEWYNLRSKVQPHMLKPKLVHAYLPAVDTITQEFVSQIPNLSDEKGEIGNFRKHLSRWGIESIGCIALDTRLDALNMEGVKGEEAKALIQAGDDLFALFHKLEFGFGQLWRIFPTPTYRKLTKVMDFFSDIALKHIEAAKKRLMENLDNEDREKTMLESFLIEEKMDSRLANTMLMDMLLGGVDTTTTTSNSVLYHLAKNPEVQQKAYEEICRALPKKDDPVTSTVLNEIRYVKSCIKETMRVTPIVSGVPRILKEDMVLAGYTVPKGTIAMFVTSVACKLKESFPDPLKFNPDRWLDEKKHNPFAFMPFGFGVRSCIGRRIAEMEMQTLLIRLLQKYRVEYHYDDVEFVTKLINVPKRPLKYRFILR